LILAGKAQQGNGGSQSAQQQQQQQQEDHQGYPIGSRLSSYASAASHVPKESAAAAAATAPEIASSSWNSSFDSSAGFAAAQVSLSPWVSQFSRV
jgi:hypothetical protein